MNKESTRNIRLGIFVVVGAVLLIFGLYSIGNNKNMFGKTFRLYSYFYDVNGLTAGNNVRYSGIDVGTVDKIEIINDSIVRIEMLIDNSIKKFIRSNSIASVGTDGLMGNKLVNIAPGTVEAPLVNENGEIRSLKTVNTEEMLRTLDLTNNNISIISSNLKEITDNVNKSRGTLYTVLTDTTLAKNVDLTLKNIQFVSNNLVQTSNQLSIIVNDVNRGQGALGFMLKDTTLPGDLRVAVKNIREGSEDFSKISGEVNEIINQINSGKGVVAGLLKDSVMSGDLKTSLSNMESASRKLDDNLEALKHSFLLRGYFRRIEKESKKSSK
jgi:phospholipid/cholesterol/gamma-HCH transport system substrate-binding protein